MYIVVTGAAGFIGSNIVKALNEQDEFDVLVVDDLKHGDKFLNLVDCEIADYIDKEDFIDALDQGVFEDEIVAISHQGACSDTTERDGRYMMQNNYTFSKRVFSFCKEGQIPFIYASSAAVYGAGHEFREDLSCEAPLNIYGYSKFQFDQFVRRNWSERTAQVVGLRYFNVYGEREQHKGRMASVAFHFFNQYRSSGKVRLFEGSGGYAAGEQRRDFISVEDVVAVNLFFLQHPQHSGIYNVGTGAAQSFNEVAVAVINGCRLHDGQRLLTLEGMRSQGLIEYIAFPPDLEGKYQSYTQADIGALRKLGYSKPFLNVDQGVSRYLDKLVQRRHR